jgi:6-phosphogluconolactonase
MNRLFLPLLLSSFCLSAMSASPTLQVFFGTYTPAGGASRGIYTAQLDLATGALSPAVLAGEAANPTFIAWRPDGRALYALGEKGTVNGKAGGALAAFRFDPASGQLAPLNLEATTGGPLAHVNVDLSGRVAVAISYHAGEVSSFPIQTDGSLGPRASLLQTVGTLGPNIKRQEKPHPHSLTFSPDNRFVYVCDLGLDRIFRFTLDPATAVLTPAGETATTPGAGPRHSKFSADGKFFYVINELDSSITTYAVDAATGALAPLQSLSTLPAGFNGENICAEIRLSPDGRFVYGSNRGHDSLAVYARDAASGRLTPVEIVPSGGKHPRNFNLTPDGRWLLSANRDTDNVVVFRVDPASGRLTPAGHELKVPQAVCVLFAP